LRLWLLRLGLLRLGLLRLGLLRLGLLRLGRALLAGFVLAAAAAAAMPLRLSLAIVQSGSQLRLGRGRFNRHACTSWYFVIWCIEFWVQPSP
jgi:hypothetical protein